MSRTVATPPATRERALRLAREHGAAEASRQTGVPSGTIRAWLHRDHAPPPPAVPGDIDIARMRKTATEARCAADDALRQLRAVIPSSRGPQSLAISVGIMIDKVFALNQHIQANEEHEARVSQQQGQVIAACIRLFLEALDVPPTPAVHRLLADIIRRGSQESTLAVSPELAEPARQDLHNHVRRQIATELSDERGLPAPDDPVDAEVVIDDEPSHAREGSTYVEPAAGVPDSGQLDTPASSPPAVAEKVERPWRPRFPGDVGPDLHAPVLRSPSTLRPLTPPGWGRP